MNNLPNEYFHSWIEQPGTVLNVSRSNCTPLPLDIIFSIEKGHNSEDFQNHYKIQYDTTSKSPLMRADRESEFLVPLDTRNKKNNISENPDTHK